MLNEFKAISQAVVSLNNEPKLIIAMRNPFMSEKTSFFCWVLF